MQAEDNPDAAPQWSRRSALFGGMLLCTSAAAAGLKLRERVQKPIDVPLGQGIPNQVGQWTALDGGSLVRPPEDGEKSIYDQEVSRIYTTSSLPPVMLLIAYGSTQSDTLQVHRPEFCYPAAGFEIDPAEELVIRASGQRLVPAAFFTGVRGDRIEHVLYWTRLGDQFPTTWLNQHISRVKNSARGLVPDGILVRASLIGDDRQAARAILVRFLQDLTARSSPVAVRALVG